MIEIAVKKQLGEKKEIKLDDIVARNFGKVDLSSLYHPIFILVSFIIYFSLQGGSSFTDNYINSQKGSFFFINSQLSIYPNLEYNLTQLGDALVIFPFVFIFLFLAPKFWQAMISSSIITLITSAVLKSIFAVPRPAAMLDINTFTVIGRPNILHTSFPSGHSMTAFMVITILLYAFMPKKIWHKLFWSIGLITIGLTISFSRVAVGAHYPFDVIIGCSLGFIAGIIGITVNKNVSWLAWMKNRKFYPIIMLILSIWAYLVVLKLIKYNLVIFYLSLTALVVTFLVIANKYVQKTEA